MSRLVFDDLYQTLKEDTEVSSKKRVQLQPLFDNLQNHFDILRDIALYPVTTKYHEMSIEQKWVDIAQAVIALRKALAQS